MAAPGDHVASGNAEENILYDLLINTEWPPEPDLQPRGNREHGTSFVLTKAITGPVLYILQYVWYSPAKFSLPSGLVRLINKQINWHLELTSNGKLLAAVQDLCVEIRSAKDDFGSVIGKCQVPKDPNPQWRRVAWSHDCTLVAYAESTGTVRLFDLMGSELFVIPSQTSLPGDLSYAIAGLLFLEYKASTQWSAELLVINYRGQLKSYLVSVGANQSFQESHSFHFGYHYPHGISSVAYHAEHRLLLIGGTGTTEDGVSKATQCGISAWRVLSGSPHYKQVTSYEDDMSTAMKRKGLWRIINVRLSPRHGTEQDGIFKMSLSPDGKLLAAIHFSGKLTIWNVPSMKLQGEWTQNEQPGFDEINPDWRTAVEKRKKMKDKESYYCLMDINWWAENAVILARCSGSLTVSSVKTLKNLLGKSCEWFEPSPQVTAAHDGGFLSLEVHIEEGELSIVPWNEEEHRDKDWCEDPDCKNLIEPCPADLAEFLYDEQPELLVYKTDLLSIDHVKGWYLNRAEEVENYSRQVDGALSLVRLGKERNIPGLQVLCDDLVTLETLVYEAGCDPSVTLKDLRQIKDIDKLNLLMKNSSEEHYVKDAYQWMVPFLHRCEAQTPGQANKLLEEYLVMLAKDDLKFPLKVFQHSKPDCQQKLIPDQDKLMTIALDCIYVCERDNQLALCYDILECLPQRGYGCDTDMTKSLHDKVDQLEQILSVSEILEKHGLQKPISFVKDTQENPKEAHNLIVRLTRHTGRKQPPVSESHWKGLLQDILEMQQNVYNCLDEDTCYEGFQVTRSPGALLQMKMGLPWIFGPTNGPLEQLSCGVFLIWACQKLLQSLQIFSLSSELDADIEGVLHISSGFGLQPLDNQHFSLRVNRRHVCRGLFKVDVKV
ncbi:hypothetical protein GDO86_010443 [Hymenochirus boettgeri]|uniref:Neuroblastoma-amplified sequence N-terminal domain-containing protein n=1 Tax=Hymenochirus boettgeri TaxID=247094 RepID=A0A8T2JQE8_9PIPI|nr:hypothetical protein GDO86_010443 [Hymenochirus boettgeri]